MTLSFQNHKGLYWACENVISNRQPADRKCSLATDRHWCKTASHEMSHACMNKQNTQAYTHTLTNTNRPGSQHHRRQMLIWILHNMIKASSSASIQIHLLPQSNFAFKFLHPNDYGGIFYEKKARMQHTKLLFSFNESTGEHLSRLCALV